MLAALLLIQAAGVPSVEAEALGRRLAAHGTMATILPLAGAKEIDDLVAAHPDLPAAEPQRLRKVAAAELAAGTARIEAAFGHAYAERLSLADLRVLVEQVESAPQRRLQAILPGVLADTMGLVGSIDLKRDALAAYCRETGKLCEAKP